MSNYGKVDLLWLDGGWVRPFSSIDSSVSWQKSVPYDPGYRYAEDRGHGKKQTTGHAHRRSHRGGRVRELPHTEAMIPSETNPIPGESCMPMSTSWSYVRMRGNKSMNTLLTHVVQCREQGRKFFAECSARARMAIGTVFRLKEIGAWMKVNSDAIYGTTFIKPYKEGKFVFTKKADNYMPSTSPMKAKR